MWRAVQKLKAKIGKVHITKDPTYSELTEAYDVEKKRVVDSQRRIKVMMKSTAPLTKTLSKMADPWLSPFLDFYTDSEGLESEFSGFRENFSTFGSSLTAYTDSMTDDCLKPLAEYQKRLHAIKPLLMKRSKNRSRYDDARAVYRRVLEKEQSLKFRLLAARARAADQPSQLKSAESAMQSLAEKKVQASLRLDDYRADFEESDSDAKRALIDVLRRKTEVYGAYSTAAFGLTVGCVDSVGEDMDKLGESLNQLSEALRRRFKTMSALTDSELIPAGGLSSLSSEVAVDSAEDSAEATSAAGEVSADGETAAATEEAEGEVVVGEASASVEEVGSQSSPEASSSDAVAKDAVADDSEAPATKDVPTASEEAAVPASKVVRTTSEEAAVPASEDPLAIVLDSPAEDPVDDANEDVGSEKASEGDGEDDDVDEEEGNAVDVEAAGEGEDVTETPETS